MLVDPCLEPIFKHLPGRFPVMIRPADGHFARDTSLVVLCQGGNLIVWSSFLLARRLRRVRDRMAA